MPNDKATWIIEDKDKVPYGYLYYAHCSKCGFEIDNLKFKELKQYKYCPQCGRKMTIEGGSSND